MCEQCIHAVLTDWQLEAFCQHFDVTPNELETNFNGWRKHVVLSSDRVFLFPRTPEFLGEFQRELDLYETFAGIRALPLPRLIDRVKDNLICYYEFGVVNRLPGVPFAHLMEGMNYDTFEEVLCRLVDLSYQWHLLPREQLPSVLPVSAGEVTEQLTLNNWHEKALSLDSITEAVAFIYNFINRLAQPGDLPGRLRQAAETQQLWLEAFMELARIPKVLVHADLHEESFLVNPDTLEITGVLDWGVARLGNPIWDYNLCNWGLGICPWFQHFPSLRRAVWRRYQDIASISLSTLEGLHLFYTLWEMIWMLYDRRNRSSIVITGTDYTTAVRIYLDTLNAATEALV